MMPKISTTVMLGALSLSCIVLLGGCASSQGIVSKARILEPLLQRTHSTEPADVDASISAQWWSGFGDAQLNQLVEQAIHNNPSLRMVQSRLERVQAINEVVDAVSRPAVTASADLTHQLFTTNGLYPPPLAGSVHDTGTLQASGSWELDFFGKNRAALDAALGQIQAAQADAQAAHMLLASSVVRSYFQLLRLQAQSNIGQQSLEQKEQMYKLVQERAKAGLDTPLELRQSEGGLVEARLQLEVLQEQLELTRNALAALISTPNQPLTLVLRAQETIKPIAIATKIPLDLLARRPDIAAAKQRVLAAGKEVDNASAQFYPNINLVAFAGLSSIGFDKLLQGSSQQWGVGPAIRLPLFDGGRLRANLRVKTSELDLAIESYNSVVLDAVRDVSDQLALARAIASQQVHQERAQGTAQAALDITRQRFKAGLANALHVLSAQAAVLAQNRQSVDLAARALDTQVQLIRALGGGYHDATAALSSVAPLQQN